ncbi:MAG: hypothetical protein ACKV2O_13390 [Acidimicrobiales bacterium]
MTAARRTSCAPLAVLRTRTLAVSLAVGLCSLVLAGCGDPVDTASMAQIGGERFEEIRFDELYRPANAVSKTRTRVDRVQSEALSLEGASPESVVNAYAQVLTEQGWEQVQAPQGKRNQTWFGAWTRLGRNVVVTAQFGDPAEEGAAPPVDFTLAFQRPTANDQITGVNNDPITEG